MKKNILIVDDFENALFVTGFTIQQGGYGVFKATSAKEALKILNVNTNISLIITDYNMPVMNGLDFVQELKKLPVYAKVPVFILSTEAKEEVQRAAKALGVTFWLRKPFKTETLIDYIKRALNDR